MATRYFFSDQSELVYKTQGMAAFHAQEDAQQDIPMEEGPYATLLKKNSQASGTIADPR